MIDTHLHLWNPARHQYPWLDALPELRKEFGLEAYAAATAGRVSGSVFVECAAAAESAAAEARDILALAEDPNNGLLGVVACVWPESDDFEQKLNEIEGRPQLKGLRRTLHTEPDDLSQSAQFRRHVGTLGRRNLSFDLCMLERQLPLAVELVDACPETQFVLDHCGVPEMGGDPRTEWRAGIAALAERPNVVCKVSGILLYAPEAARSAGGVLPWVEQVLESFGWDRVVWGGDWPVCTLAVPLSTWIDVTHELLDAVRATPDQRDALLEANARRIYRL